MRLKEVLRRVEICFVGEDLGGRRDGMDMEISRGWEGEGGRVDVGEGSPRVRRGVFLG